MIHRDLKAKGRIQRSRPIEQKNLNQTVEISVRVRIKGLRDRIKSIEIARRPLCLVALIESVFLLLIPLGEGNFAFAITLFDLQKLHGVADAELKGNIA